MESNSSERSAILLTGASSGLGLEIAKRLLRRPRKDILILTARQSSLHRFAKNGIADSDSVWIRPLDVMNEPDRSALFGELKREGVYVRGLINNAGFSFRSVLEHVRQEELLQQMITNFWGPMELIRLALPEMRRRRSGRIINISSVGGMMAMPTMSVYSASKFALEGATEALYYEVKPWNISVTLVEPGFINSDSFDNVRYTTLSGESMRDPSEAYFGHYRFMTEFIGKLMKRSFSDSEAVATKVEQALDMKNPPLRMSGTFDAVAFDLMRRILPRRLYHWVLYRALPFPDCWGDVDRLKDRCEMERSRFLMG